MKRSEINNAIKWAIGFLKKANVPLPCFGYWTKEQFENSRDNINAIKKVMQGWDVTDFGSGDFSKTGAVLFTVRNGDVNDQSAGTPYAEKYIMLKPGQGMPLHKHNMKTEDIISRGGAAFEIRLYNSGNDGKPDPLSDINVYCDGIKKTYRAGEAITVTNGNSVTLKPGLYHTIRALSGAGDVLIGEVSSINDDNTDNCFAEDVPRFSRIEEDEPAAYVLCNEYD